MLLAGLLLAACNADSRPERPAPSLVPAPALRQPAAAPTEPEPPPAGTISGSPILPEPIVLGGIETPAVRSVIEAAGPALQACYTAELAAHPDLAGKVLVRFTITHDGRVSRATTKSTSLRHAPTEECLNERIGGLQFPKLPDQGVALVTWPFIFPS
jgi:hypothetical protein